MVGKNDAKLTIRLPSDLLEKANEKADHGRPQSHCGEEHNMCLVGDPCSIIRSNEMEVA